MTEHTQQRGAGYFVGGGVVAGLIAGMVMAIVVMMVTAFSGMGLFAGPEMIGQTLLRGQSGAGVTVVGLMVHMMNSAIFGIIWGLIWRGIAKAGGTAVIGGVVYGLVIWLVMTYAVLPILSSPVPGPILPVAWAMAHLMFGLVLGLWPALQSRPFTALSHA
ncbi:MAG: hypothetical protein HY684_04775 [Chloroflexi bacterium]|nr:hypothetical protein [Chloroflexota bacterium]